MLNKGLRDQESMRIESILKTLLSIINVPKYLTKEDKDHLENALKDFGLNFQTLIDITPNDLFIHLNRLHLDWNQQEQFADFLLSLSKESQFDFRNKAIAIYDYVQKESKIFSFGIFNKLAAAKASL